ncbi:MAG: DUF1329 domain-containing protein [Gammaproteobacteria bacterium]
MNSDATLPAGVARGARRAFAVVCLLALAGAAGAQERTWRTVDELTDDERALYDPALATARDPALPYLPAEPYPFEPPYTAEEMGYRSAEFPHISRWPHSLIDVFGVITSSGYINQGAGVSYVMQNSKPGLGSYLRDVPAGQINDRWLIYSMFPPETEAEQQLWLIYRTDPKFATKMDFFVYSPAMRRVRRQPQPRRDQRFPDNAQTFDDVIGRDPWEMEWKLLGTDVLHTTVRYPNTRPTVTLNDGGKGFVEHQTSAIRPMGPDYPHYRGDGGVDCWVVMGTVRTDVVPDYNEKFLIFWLDKQHFYPLRTEKYGQDGNLIMIEVRNARLEAPAREGFGYAANTSVYWDLEHDIMSYSFHDGHRPHEWTAEEQAMIFTPEFMRRQWLIEPIKSQALIENPEHYFLRPELDRDKFPDVRKIALPPDLEARIQAQESAGHLVFESGESASAQ